MKRSLQAKVILTYLAVALITVLVVSVLIRLTSSQSLMNLVAEQQTSRLKEAISTYYASNSSLDGFFEYYLQTAPREPVPVQPVNPGILPVAHELRGVAGLVDSRYRALIPTFGFQIGETVPEEIVKQAESVEVDG